MGELWLEEGFSGFCRKLSCRVGLGDVPLDLLSVWRAGITGLGVAACA